MKKVSTMMLCTLLACCLLFSACTSNPDNSGGGTQGRYVETDITPHEAEGKTLKSFLLPGGGIRSYSTDLADIYESNDGGKTWEHGPGPGAGEALGAVGEFTMLEDGSLLVALMGEMGMLESLVKVAPDGTSAPFPLEALDKLIAEKKNVYLSHLQALPDNRLLLGYGSGGVTMGGDDFADSEEGGDATADDGEGAPAEVNDDAPAEGGIMFNDGEDVHKTMLYDLGAGKELADLSEQNIASASADGQNAYFVDYEGNVSARSLADGSPVSNFSGSFPLEEFGQMTLGGGEKLLASDGKRLFQNGADGGAEVLLEGGAYAFSAPGMRVNSIDRLEDDGILMTLQGSEGSKLYRIDWDENAKVDPAKTIKIWSLRDSATLRAAINAFRQKHPDATIEYEVAMNEDTTAEDAIKNLNTRLVSGDGPDVMLLDGCPMESFADKGVLADLSKLVDTKDMFENLRTPFETDKGTFYLPMAMRIPALVGTPDGLNAKTLEELMQKVEAGKGRPVGSADMNDSFRSLPEEERPVFSFDDLREAFDLLWNASAPDVIGSEGIDKDKLRTLLTSLKTMSDKYRLTDEDARMGSVMVATDGAEDSVIKGSAISYGMQRALLGGMAMGDLTSLDFVNGPKGTEFAPFPGLTEGAWLPSAIVGINADSEVKEFAAELLQTMLGDDVQGARAGGLPVTEKGLNRQIDAFNRQMQEASMGGAEGGEFDVDLISLIKQLKQPVLTEDVLTEAVWANADKFCRGEVDLEGAVSGIEQAIKTYLAERQ